MFSFIVGPYHQSAMKDEKEARSPCLCDRAHRPTIERTCNRACGPGLSTNLAIECIHIDLRNTRRPSRHCFHCCAVGYWSSYVRSSVKPAIEPPSLSRQNSFSINRTTCVNLWVLRFLSVFSQQRPLFGYAKTL